MTDVKRPTITIPSIMDDQRSDREIILETNRLIQMLALRGTKTLVELEHAMNMIAEPTSALNLSSRTAAALASAGIVTVRDLLAQTPSSLLQHESIGRLARNEVIEVLSVHGLRLADSEPVERIQPHSASSRASQEPTRPAPETAQKSSETSPPPVFDTPLGKGDVVSHPTKPDWGIGRVQSVTSDGVATILFAEAGEKNISLKAIQLTKLQQQLNAPPLKPKEDILREAPPGKIMCTNCGQPTLFTENAAPQRRSLGWCDACYKHSQRTFKDSVTGETRYFDELRTVDGIKNRYSPK